MTDDEYRQIVENLKRPHDAEDLKMKLLFDESNFQILIHEIDRLKFYGRWCLALTIGMYAGFLVLMVGRLFA